MQSLVALGFVAMYSEISKVFPLSGQIKLVTPHIGAKFDPRAIIWALLVEVH